jgi:hypothetical protein
MSLTPVDNFMTKNNIELIWELIVDESLQNRSHDDIHDIRKTFDEEIRLFYNTISNTSGLKQHSLIQLNQSFLTKMMQTLQQVQIQQPQRQSFLAEDIQKERVNQFESDLTRKKQEFDNAITLKKPPVPVFEDSKRSDRVPINEMEALIAQTISQRNYDISNLPMNTSTNIKWLSSQETSVKVENRQSNQDAIKYIKIERDQLPPLTEIIDLSEEKRISWNDGIRNDNDNDNRSNANITKNIFSKLKVKQTDQNEFEILKSRIDSLERKIEMILEQIHHSNH